jgi:hypothetical protein
MLCPNFFRDFFKKKSRQEKDNNLEVLIEFVVPIIANWQSNCCFDVYLIRVCRRKADGHFIIKEIDYTLNTQTCRFILGGITRETDRLLDICRLYPWMLDITVLNKLIQTGFIVCLAQPAEMPIVYKTLSVLKGHASALLL